VYDYVSIAVRLANDPHWREYIVTRIFRNKHKIYLDGECITDLERFLMNVSGRSPRESYAAT